MDLPDLLWAGLKLLGTYFGVYGVSEVMIFGLRVVLTNLGTISYSTPGFNSLELVSGTEAVVYLAAAFVLIRHTGWCVGKLSGSEGEELDEEVEPAEEDV